LMPAGDEGVVARCAPRVGRHLALQPARQQRVHPPPGEGGAQQLEILGVGIAGQQQRRARAGGDELDHAVARGAQADGLAHRQEARQHKLILVPKEMFSAIDKFPLAAIPFFILAGNLMETGGISRRLVNFAKSLVGGVQGGLPMTCVLTCMIFAAVSGSSVATTFAIGSILIPALIKHGYRY